MMEKTKEDLQLDIKQQCAQLAEFGVEWLLVTVGVVEWSSSSAGSKTALEFLETANVVKEFVQFCKESRASEEARVLDDQEKRPHKQPGDERHPLREKTTDQVDSTGSFSCNPSSDFLEKVKLEEKIVSSSRLLRSKRKGDGTPGNNQLVFNTNNGESTTVHPSLVKGTGEKSTSIYGLNSEKSCSEGVLQDSVRGTVDRVLDGKHENKLQRTKETKSGTVYKIHTSDISKNTFQTKGNLLKHKRQSHELDEENQGLVHPQQKKPNIGKCLTGKPEVKIPKKGDLFACSFCSKMFHFKSAAKRHIEIKHLKSKEKKWNCPSCEARFWDKFTLDRHREIHSPRTTFACSVEGCKATFLSQKAHDNHTKTHSKYLCDHCGKSFKYLSYLQHHSVLHQDDKTFKCDICEKLFKSKNTLRCHMKVHESLSRFVCEICGKVFKAFANLYVHMRMHNDIRKFRCEVCNKAYRKRDSLDMHKLAQKHFGKDESQDGITFTECELCQKKFAGTRESYRFSRHLLSHSTEKRYQCDMCDKAFKTSGSLKQHQLLHTGNSPSCSLCGQKFRSERKLHQHLSDIHKDGVTVSSSEPTPSSLDNSGQMQERQVSANNGGDSHRTQTLVIDGVPTGDIHQQTVTQPLTSSYPNTALTHSSVSTSNSVTFCANFAQQDANIRVCEDTQHFEDHSGVTAPSMHHFVRQTAQDIQETETSYQNLLLDADPYNTPS